MEWYEIVYVMGWACAFTIHCIFDGYGVMEPKEREGILLGLVFATLWPAILLFVIAQIIWVLFKDKAA